MLAPVTTQGRSAETTHALRTWVATRAVVAAYVVVVAWVAGVRAGERAESLPTWLVMRFAHWDSNLYGAIAERGYPPVGHPHSYFAFLPGYPWLLRGGRVVGLSPQAFGLAVTVALGLVVAVLLARVARDLLGDAAGARWSVVTLAVAPMTVFFSAVYTEVPFLALALGAWLLGRRGRWAGGGALAGLACTLRPTGPALVLGLAVMFVLQRLEARRRGSPTRARDLLGAATLALGPLFVVGYVVWLHSRTGQWDAWTVAQWEGFGRASAPPWVGLADVIGKIASADSWHLLVVRCLDVVAAVAVWLGVVWLWRRRWWPEFAYVLACAVAQTFSTIWDSGPRYLHAAFPLLVLVGGWLARRRPPVRALWLTASGLVALFATTGWALQWWVA